MALFEPAVLGTQGPRPMAGRWSQGRGALVGVGLLVRQTGKDQVEDVALLRSHRGHVGIEGVHVPEERQTELAALSTEASSLRAVRGQMASPLPTFKIAMDLQVPQLLNPW